MAKSMHFFFFFCKEWFRFGAPSAVFRGHWRDPSKCCRMNHSQLCAEGTLSSLSSPELRGAMLSQPTLSYHT